MHVHSPIPAIVQNQEPEIPLWGFDRVAYHSDPEIGRLHVLFNFGRDKCSYTALWCEELIVPDPAGNCDFTMLPPMRVAEAGEDLYDKNVSPFAWPRLRPATQCAHTGCGPLAEGYPLGECHTERCLMMKWISYEPQRLYVSGVRCT